jgi:hypothetical protein
MRLGENDHIFLLVVHHIIVDGWSIGIFLEELAHFYSAFAAGHSPQLSEAPVQFSDFARWQRRWCAGGMADQQVAFWKKQLRRAPAVFGAQRAPGPEVMTSPTTDEPIHLAETFGDRLAALSRARGVTLYMTLLTAFKVLLATRTGGDDICVATGMANRVHEGIERTIGPVENTILIRTRRHANLSFQEVLHRVRDSVLDAHARQELPFNVLASRLAEDGVDTASITQVFFVMQNARGAFKLPGLTVRPFGNFYREGQPVLPIDTAWLTVTLRERAPGITGMCTYKPDLFGAHLQGEWMTQYRKILSKAAADPEVPLLKLAAH